MISSPRNAALFLTTSLWVGCSFKDDVAVRSLPALTRHGSNLIRGKAPPTALGYAHNPIVYAKGREIEPNEPYSGGHADRVLRQSESSRRTDVELKHRRSNRNTHCPHANSRLHRRGAKRGWLNRDHTHAQNFVHRPFRRQWSSQCASADWQHALFGRRLHTGRSTGWLGRDVGPGYRRKARVCCVATSQRWHYRRYC